MSISDITIIKTMFIRSLKGFFLNFIKANKVLYKKNNEEMAGAENNKKIPKLKLKKPIDEELNFKDFISEISI